MAQLGYVIGEDNLDKTLKQYYKDWAFKHPTPNDFIRVAEKVSGFELDWYLTDWTQTTNTIDYAITNVQQDEDGNYIFLERIGLMPMPIDLLIEYEDGYEEFFHIPLQMARAVKPHESDIPRRVMPDWSWANPEYNIMIGGDRKVLKVTIDPSGLMADINKENNVYSMN
jgi:aminopeptidase N